MTFSINIENLPAPPDGFVGRQLDMFNIVSTLIKKSRRIMSVIGEKGIGKSAIVKKAIHYLADRGSFADGILHIHIAKNHLQYHRSSRAAATADYYCTDII